MGGRFIGLLVACAMLATFALSSGDRAGAFGTACIDGEWVVTSGTGHVHVNPGSRSGVPCDEPKPGWTFDWNNPGHIMWVYDGDRVVTPDSNPGSSEVYTAVREVHEQGNKRPAINQPVADETSTVTPFTYNAGPDNRAVRGADGQCYREWLLDGHWRRSAPYGSDAEACRKAGWNAHYRSQGLPLVNPADGTFPSGSPPDRDSQGRVIMPSKLVANLGQSTAGFARWRTGRSYAQQFTAGSPGEGYEDWVVSAVDLLIHDTSSGDPGMPAVTVTIRHASGGAPGDVVGTLQAPQVIGAGVRTFTASGDAIRLQGGTDYFVVVEVTTAGGGIAHWATPAEAEDPGASSGWSIHDVYSYTGTSGAWLHNCCNAFKIAVTGYAR